MVYMIKLGNYKPQNYWNNHTKTDSFNNHYYPNSSKYYGFWRSDCTYWTVEYLLDREYQKISVGDQFKLT